VPAAQRRRPTVDPASRPIDGHGAQQPAHLALFDRERVILNRADIAEVLPQPATATSGSSIWISARIAPAHRADKPGVSSSAMSPNTFSTCPLFVGVAE
jgi:hypothetical protein